MKDQMTTRQFLGTLGAGLATMAFGGTEARAHEGHGHETVLAQARVGTSGVERAVPGITGQGEYRFSLSKPLSQLPAEVAKHVGKAHGGFVVHPDTGEIFTGINGVGLLVFSKDLTEKRVIASPAAIQGNAHGLDFVRDTRGRLWLAIANNDLGRVFLVDPKTGKSAYSLGHPADSANWYKPQWEFHPTDIQAFGKGEALVVDGYGSSKLGMLMPVPKKASESPVWRSAPFGGRAATPREPGRFSTTHGLDFSDGQVFVADREHSRILVYSAEALRRTQNQVAPMQTIELPSGAHPCDVHVSKDCILVPCLNGPKPEFADGAPVYVLDRQGKILSTVRAKADLGVAEATHIHNALLLPSGQMLLHLWNPGGIAVLNRER